MDKQSKIQRTLDIYARLCEGKVISKNTEAQNFGVDSRSIQRDIDEIRSFLANYQQEHTADTREILYDRSKKGFIMTGLTDKIMTNSEVLAISKILLESRAFTKQEISQILNKLISNCVSTENIKQVSNLIANEKHHYIEPHNKSKIQDILWDIGQDILNNNLIELTYEKQVSAKETVLRLVEPSAILFSEYYFYLIAYIVEESQSGIYTHKYEHPAVFRLDRIQSYHSTGIKFRMAYANRFEEGEFRKRIQFMYPGKLTRLQLKYTGTNAEAILDRLPTARITSKQKNEYIIEAEVYGKGILMWLLSQGTSIEVLSPDSIRTEMKSLLSEMLQKYD